MMQCGKFYERSLSVWSALLTLQGFVYNGPAGHIGFRLVLTPEDHASFFTAAEGYGLFSQKQENNKLKASIALKEGKFRLTEIILAVPGGKQVKSVKVIFDGKAVKPLVDVKDGDVLIMLLSPIDMRAGHRLAIELSM